MANPASKLLLSVETSSALASVALWGEQGLCFQSKFAAGRGVPEQLFAELEEALALVSEDSQLVLVVGLGPGSYTGVRKGIAAVQGLSLARAWPCVGLPLAASLPSLGANQASKGWICGDARRGEWFLQSYQRGELGELMLLAPAEFMAFVEALSAHELVVSTDCFWASDEPDVVEFLQQRILLEQAQALVLAKTAWELNLAENTSEQSRSSVLLPHYVRAPMITQAKKSGKLLKQEQA